MGGETPLTLAAKADLVENVETAGAWELLHTTPTAEMTTHYCWVKSVYCNLRKMTHLNCKQLCCLITLIMTLLPIHP